MVCVMPLKSHSFTLELPSDTSHEEAHKIGKAYVESLNLQQVADYIWHGSAVIPGKPGVSRFNYSYKT
jgi:hypothetical protein